MYKNHTKVSVFSLHHGNVFGDRVLNVYYMGHLKSKASFYSIFTHYHGLSYLTQGMVLDQKLQYHSKEYTDIYIHTSFKITFKSLLHQVWLQFRSIFFFFSRLYTCMEKVGFLYILFFHNSKINFFYIAFQLTKN